MTLFYSSLMADPGDKGGLVIAGLLLAAGGVLFLAILCKDGYEEWQKKDRFMAVAKEASATVVGHEVRRSTAGRGSTGRSGPYLVPVIRFTDAAGREWTGTMNKTSIEAYRKGQKITVLYEPADPRNVWEGPPSIHSLTGIAVATAVLALGCALIVLNGRQRPADD